MGGAFDLRSGNHFRWPKHGWLGLLLVAIFWALNWGLEGVRTHWGFFPMWLGYCLVVDAVSVLRKGDSLLTRNPRAYAGLFLVSVPAWWLFEVIDWRTQNWFYEGREFFTDFEYLLLSSVSFSTVMPAVFGTAEVIATLRWLRRIPAGPRISPNRAVTVCFFVAGWFMLAMLLLWPRRYFPFVWISLYFILAPVNVWLGHRSLSQHTVTRDWAPVLALWGGVLVCAFFWEMWNFFSYPKWLYQIPYWDYLHLFEMPLLGYFGYLPFSLELFALYQFAAGLWRRWRGIEKDADYLQIEPPRPATVKIS